MSARSLKVWLLSDGLPGHVNQARGLMNYLGDEYILEVIEVSAVLRWKAIRPVLRCLVHLVTTGSLPARDQVGFRDRCLIRLLSAAYAPLTLPKEAPDLIVSAGGNTAFLNIALARSFRSHNLFMGSLRSLASEQFTAVLTLDPVSGANDAPPNNNIIMPILPSATRRSENSDAAQLLRADHSATKLWSILIGGDGVGYRYREEDWLALALALNLLGERLQVRWLLSTSRRTGKVAEAILKRTLLPEYLADANWYLESPDNPTGAYQHAAEYVFCTADSMSMLHETIDQVARVIALTPLEARPPARYMDKLHRLYDAGFMRETAMVDLHRWRPDAAHLPPQAYLGERRWLRDLQLLLPSQWPRAKSSE